MSRKSNRLKARVRMEIDKQQRWLKRSNDATLAKEDYKRSNQRIMARFGRFVQVSREREDDVLCVRYAITRREYESHRFNDDFVRAVTERCLDQLRRALDGASAETEMYS